MTEIPADRQLDDARAALAVARDHRHQASRALDAARAAYETARRHNPAGQDTDQARHAWAEAEHDLIDAHADMEKARDHLTGPCQACERRLAALLPVVQAALAAAGQRYRGLAQGLQIELRGRWTASRSRRSRGSGREWARRRAGGAGGAARAAGPTWCRCTGHRGRRDTHSSVAAEYQDLLASIWLYVKWRYVTKQLTTEQKELWADAVEAAGDPDEPVTADRWWRA